MSEQPDVAVVGRGVCSPLGSNLRDHLAGVASGRCVLGKPSRSMPPDAIEAVVAEAILPTAAGVECTFVELAAAAAAEALSEAGVDPGSVDLLVLGTTAGPRYSMDWETVGLASPANTLEGEAAFGEAGRRTAAVLGLSCPVMVLSNACSSGAAAIGHAWQYLRTGRARTAVCIGVDELFAGSILAFVAIGALSSDRCDPYRRSDGTSISEGAAAVVLTTEPGLSRTPIAWVAGVGQSADGYHPSRPEPTGSIAFSAAERALALSGTEPVVTLVSGHGTGTRANDKVEGKIDALLSARVGQPQVPTFATKGLYGHTFGAAAMIETIEMVAALRGEVDLANVAFLNDVRLDSPPPSAWVGLKNSYAMGGFNTSLVLSSSRAGGRPVAFPRPMLHSLAILTPTGVSAANASESTLSYAIEEFESLTARHLRAKRSRWSAFDNLTRITTVLVASLLEAAAADELLDRSRIGLFLASQRGPARSWNLVTEAVHNGTELDANVMPNLARHAAAGFATEMFGLHGASSLFCLTSADGRTALEAAAAAIESGCADAVVVVEADEALEGGELGAGPDQFARGCLVIGDTVVGGGAQLGAQDLGSLTSALASSAFA